MRMKRGPGVKKMPLDTWAENRDAKLRERRAAQEFGVATTKRLLEPTEVHAQAKKMLEAGAATKEQLRELVKKRPDLRNALRDILK